MSRQIVITGGSSGIGYSIAERFARAGDTVTITGRNPEKLAAAADLLGARGLRCDGTDLEQIEALADALGDIDVLIHAAGANVASAGGADDAPTLREVAELWKANLDANLLTAVLTTTALLPHVNSGGTILAIGSAAAEIAATGYGAAKAALAAWASGFSAVVGPRDITVNTIVPGYTEETDFYATPLSEQRIQAMVAATDTQRAGTPGDVAGIAYFLAGPESRNITAQAIHVSGGARRTR